MGVRWLPALRATRLALWTLGAGSACLEAGGLAPDYAYTRHLIP